MTTIDSGEPIDDDFLERPALTLSIAPNDDFRFRPGDILLQRFRIVRILGRGGMGDVYEAWDAELQSAVALKMIRAAIADNPQAIERFRAEVLRARSISHPHVCRVYDLFAHDADVRFLTMELLEGETLAVRLDRSGPLDLPTATSYARQMAAALDEAHRLDIVHRDFKPGNIMLVEGETPQGRVVVTDFGLARQRLTDEDANAHASAHALSDRHAGTLDYMAPEIQSSGRIGPAVDIYAYGVVLHEMLTGLTPARSRALAEAAPDLGSIATTPAIPHRWQKAIDECLRPDPSQRPPSATAVLDLATGEAARRRRRAIFTIASSLLLLTMALYAPLSRFLKWAPELGSNPTLVMADIENATNEPDFDSIAELLRRQLEQSPRLSIIESSRVNQTLKTMARPNDSTLPVARAREVGWRLGANAFVSGRTWNAGQAYALSVRLESVAGQPDSVGRNWSRTYEARDRDELLQRIREAANWIRSAAGEAASENPRYDRPVAEVTTSSWQALHLYSRADRLLIEGRQEDGLALLSEAVRFDPEFALAWMRMGDVLMTNRRFDDAYRHWNQAITVLRRRNLGTREEYRIRGMFANDTRDFAEAERVYRLYLVAYPGDFRPYFYIARPLLMLGRLDDAIGMMEQAGAKDPTSYAVPAQLAMFRIRAGQLDHVPADIAKLRQLEQPEWADCLQAQLDFMQGHYDRALAGFIALERAATPLLRSRAPALQAAVLADLGHTQAAIDRITHGIERDLAQGDQDARADKLLTRAQLELRLGRPQVCRDLCVQLEQIDRSSLRLARMAVLYAQAGAPNDAARLLALLPESSPSREVQTDRLRIEGEILLARGNAKKAWSAFQRAAALEAPGVLTEYLARGAEAAGEIGTALALYQRLASDQGYYWRYPEQNTGDWLEAQTNYLRLATHAQRPPDARLAAQYRALTSYTLPSP